VRYADNFLIGIRGSVVLANYVRGKLRKYLKFKLLLELKQDYKVYCVHSDVVFFLGYEVRFLRKQEEKVGYTRRELSFKKLRNQMLAKQQGLADKCNRVLYARISAAKYYKIKKLFGRKNDFTGKFLREGIIRELEAYVNYLKKISYLKNLMDPLDEFQE
jgi:hypothetical protein